MLNMRQLWHIIIIRNIIKRRLCQMFSPMIGMDGRRRDIAIKEDICASFIHVAELLCLSSKGTAFLSYTAWLHHIGIIVLLALSHGQRTLSELPSQFTKAVSINIIIKYPS